MIPDPVPKTPFTDGIPSVVERTGREHRRAQLMVLQGLRELTS